MSEATRAFLAMPYRPELRWLRNAVATAARQFEVLLVSVDEVGQPGGDVVARLRHEIVTCSFAYVVLADSNPNVFYELGLLHQASKPTILITAKTEPFPFDVRGLMHLTYEDAPAKEKELSDALAAATGKVLNLLSASGRQQIASGKVVYGSEEVVGAEFFNHHHPRVNISVVHFDFERIKQEAARAVGRKECNTTNISIHDAGAFKGWRMRARCAGGDKLTILIDLNGEVAEIDVQ